MTPAERLRAALAQVAQREFEESITGLGSVADPRYLGMRIAVAQMAVFDEVLETPVGVMATLIDSADGSGWPCPICRALEGRLHRLWCDRTGLVERVRTETGS